MQTEDRVDPVRSPLLNDASSSRIEHGFFSRGGGVSEGIYAGLNVGLGSNDKREHVHENRARVAHWFGLAPASLVTVHQVHSPNVHIATRENRSERPQADAIVSREPEIAIGVLTADCGPILLADPQNRVIGAAHAGWKGAFGGVLENTIAAMETLGAERKHIRASLGPSISQTNYEVGPEFIARFIEADRENSKWFQPSSTPGHHMFDLRGYTVTRLQNAGVQAEMIDACTYADEGKWFSYRRTTHRGEPDYGRQISAIALARD